METPSLEYFIAVAEELNISRAAQKLHITQQSLSTYIQKLEGYYDVRLLERKPRMRLTDAGRAVLAAAKEVERIHAELVGRLEDMRSQSKMTLSLGIQTPLLQILTGVLPLNEFKARYPELTVKIVSDYGLKLQQRLSNNEIDSFIQIVSSEDSWKRMLELFDAEVIIHDRKCVIITDAMLQKYFTLDYPGCIERMREGVYLSDFAAVPIVLHPTEADFSMRTKGYFRKRKLPLNVFAEGATPQLVNTMVLSDLAMGIDSVRLARREFREHSEVHIFPILDEELCRHDVVMAYKKDERGSAINRELREWLREFWRE